MGMSLCAMGDSFAKRIRVSSGEQTYGLLR